MLDDPDDDITEFEDDFDQATVFDPTPWGARQRVLPRETFIPGGAATSRAQPSAPPPLPPPALVPVPTFLPAVALPVVAPIPSLAQAWFPQPQPAWSTCPPMARAPGEPKLRALAARYAAPLFGVFAVAAFLIAYVAKPSSHARASIGTSLTAAATPSLSPDFAVTPSATAAMVISPAPEPAVTPPAPPAPAEVAPIAEPIAEPIVEPIVEPVVATVAPAAEPIVRPVVQKPRPKRAIAKSSRRIAKSASVARVTKRRPIKLDALDTATPLGRMRPGKLH